MLRTDIVAIQMDNVHNLIVSVEQTSAANVSLSTVGDVEKEVMASWVKFFY